MRVTSTLLSPNRVDDAIVSHAEPPAVLIAMQFLAADGSRVSSQFANSWKHPAYCIGRQISQLLPGGGREGDEVLRHSSLPSARNSVSTSASAKRGSLLRASETAHLRFPQPASTAPWQSLHSSYETHPTESPDRLRAAAPVPDQLPLVLYPSERVW
jgi:hypothetical protein